MLVHWCKLGLYSYDQPVELKLKFLNSSFSYTAPTKLNIKQKIKQSQQIYHSTFINVFLKISATFLRKSATKTTKSATYGSN